MVVYGRLPCHRKLVFFDVRGRKDKFLKGLGLSKSTGRAIRICFVEVSPDLVLLDIRKSIFNVLLPEEEDLLLLEQEDLLLPEEEDLIMQVQKGSARFDKVRTKVSQRFRFKPNSAEPFPTGSDANLFEPF